VKGFKKCWISSAMDETNDMVWNGSEEYGNIRSECEEDEDTDWEHSNSDIG